MSELAKKKHAPGRGDAPLSKGRNKAVNKKKLPPAKDQARDSEDIERAVYDGMQDLRADKPK